MDKENLAWIKEPNFYFKRKREVIENLIIGKAINIGCGTHIIKNAKNVDLPEFDATNSDHWLKFKGKYDTIIMSDVLEHICDERWQDVLIRAELYANKRVIITVPAYSWLYSNYDKLLGHYRRYDSFKGQLFHNGKPYVTQKIKYLFGLLIPLFCIRKFTSGKTPKLPKWADNILYGLSRITLPFGSTMLIILDRVDQQ